MAPNLGTGSDLALADALVNKRENKKSKIWDVLKIAKDVSVCSGLLGQANNASDVPRQDKIKKKEKKRIS